MKCLVTGASGFIGSHLVEFLLACGHDVYGLSRRPNDRSSDRRGFTFLTCDILDSKRLSKLVAEIGPERVFHVAAQSSPEISWADPKGTFKTNVFGTLNLLDAIRAVSLRPRIEVFCSSGEYATSSNGAPVREDSCLRPSNPYALSKVSQDQLCVLYGEVYKLSIVRLRPFFIIGPGKTGDVTSDFARGIVKIERGLENSLKVGSLEPIRDFLPIKDALVAFDLVAERGVAGEVYNICSGRGYEIGQILQLLKAQAKTWIEIQQDQALFRLLDERVKIGDNNKIRGLGWMQAQTVEEALGEVLNYWRNHEGLSSTLVEAGRCVRSRL